MIPINILNLPVKYNFSLVRNDNLTKTFSFKENNIDYSLVGSTVVMKISTDYDIPSIYQITGTIATNTVSFLFDTETAVAGNFVFDIQQTNGSTVKTLVKGALVIEKDVTP